MPRTWLCPWVRYPTSRNNPCFYRTCPVLARAGFFRIYLFPTLLGRAKKCTLCSMMSSKRAAAKAAWEILEIISQKGEEVIFKAHGEMSWLNLSRSGYHKKLKKLEKHGLVKKKRTPLGDVFEITPKAKLLRRKAITKQARTDGLSTLIIFDIPEDQHNVRDTLRRYLVRSGYTQIRESCFLSQFQISRDLKELIDELKVKSDITIFSARMNFF